MEKEININIITTYLDYVKTDYLESKKSNSFNIININKLNEKVIKYTLQFLYYMINNKDDNDDIKIGGWWPFSSSKIKIQPYINKILPELNKLSIIDNQLKENKKKINNINKEINTTINKFPDGEIIVTKQDKYDIYIQKKEEILKNKQELIKIKLISLQITIQSIILLNEMLINKLKQRKIIIDYNNDILTDLELLSKLCKINLTDAEKEQIYNYAVKYLNITNKLLSLPRPPSPPLVFPDVPVHTPRLKGGKKLNNLKIKY